MGWVTGATPDAVEVHLDRGAVTFAVPAGSGPPGAQYVQVPGGGKGAVRHPLPPAGVRPLRVAPSLTRASLRADPSLAGAA
eukprot:gene26700-60707_t